MTEDLDSRLAALQARRSRPNAAPRVTPATDQAGSGERATDPEPVTTRSRPTHATKRSKKHAAPASRILALGISASAAIALTGIMTRSVADPAATADPSAIATAVPTQAPVVVHVVLPNGQTVQATQTPASAPIVASAQPAQRTTSPTVATRTRAS